MNFIPIIDLGKLSPSVLSKEPGEDWIAVAREIEKALHGIGFMYLVNHGVSNDMVQNGFHASSTFFALDSQVKEKYRKKPSESSHGWVQAGQELLNANSVFELRECFDYINSNRPPIIQAPKFYTTMEQLQQECNALIKTLLKLLGLALELEDPEHFLKSSAHLDDPSIPNECDLRAIYYPPIPKGKEILEGTVRCAEHTDYEAFTLLFQDDVGGLEVKSANGSWVPATPIPGAILFNTGDLLEFWTNRYFPATYHRVVIPQKEMEEVIPRYSVAYFFAPDNSTLVQPLESKILCSATGDGGTARAVTAYHHIMERVKTAYQY